MPDTPKSPDTTTPDQKPGSDKPGPSTGPTPGPSPNKPNPNR